MGIDYFFHFGGIDSIARTLDNSFDSAGNNTKPPPPQHSPCLLYGARFDHHGVPLTPGVCFFEPIVISQHHRGPMDTYFSLLANRHFFIGVRFDNFEAISRKRQTHTAFFVDFFFFEIYTGLVPCPEKKKFQPLYRVNVFYPGTVSSVSPYEYVPQKRFFIVHCDK